MRSHEKIIKIKNRIKNSRRKITPWRKHRLAFNASKEHLAGVQRQNRAWFWRWTPKMGSILALNAQNKHGSGVQRQKWATNGRSTPKTSTNLALNTQSCVQGHFACLIWCKVVNPWTPQDLWTPQDHLRICGPHRIPTYLHSYSPLFSFIVSSQ